MRHLAAPATGWRHPHDSPPPRACKILVYTTTGIAVIGHWRDDDSALWMPLPEVPWELKRRLEENGNYVLPIG